MIKLNITAEVIVDIFTPGVITNMSKLVKGLPKGAKLHSINKNEETGLYEFLFYDGKDAVTESTLMWKI